MAKLKFPTFDKRMRDLGYTKRSAFYGATPHYEKRIDLGHNDYATNDRESHYSSHLIIKVNCYNWYKEGYAVNGVELKQINNSSSSGANGSNFKRDNSETSVHGYQNGGLTNGQLNELMEALNSLHAFMNEEETE